DQGVEIFHRFGNHVAAAPAVTAVRSTIFDELLTAERDTAIAASSAGGIDLGDIKKTHGFRLFYWSLRLSPALLSGLFSQEIGPRQQHVMAEDLHAPGPAFPHGRAVMARPQLGQDMSRGGIVVEPAGMELLYRQRLKGIAHQPVRRLGGIAQTPEGPAQPVAELAGIVGVEACRAQEQPVALAGDHEAV